MSTLPSPAQIDGVRLAVVASRFDGIVRSMMNTMLRSSRSGVLNSARDFSCCILNANGDIVATGESLPVHVMSGPELIVAAMHRHYRELAPGDAFLHNNPYDGNSHAADHTTLVPVFDGAGRHRFTVLVKAHQADCGNSIPTTYMATATDVYNEGALIFPCVRIQRKGRDCEDLLRMCELRLRVPEQWRGDYNAAIGAARIGERKLTELAAELGWDTLAELVEQWFDYSERRFASEVAALAAGSITVTARHDPFPGLPDGIDLTITVAVDPVAGRIAVDLRDNPDCQPCGLNLTESTSRTAAMIGIFNSIDPTVPPNSGSFRRIDVELRENCVVGIPRHPASCSAATTNIADRVANAVQRGLAELVEGSGRAEVASVIPSCCGVIAGVDPRRGDAPFVNQIFLGFGGGGASASADGWFTAAHVGNAGMVTIDSVEMDEARFPLLVRSRVLRIDSEGAGRFRGAPGASIEFGPHRGEFSVAYAADGYQTPAMGVRGGRAGAPGREWKREPDGSLSPLPPCAQVMLRDGESILSQTPGGGGYGDPSKRAPEAVLVDVRERWISAERARTAYGVDLEART